MNVVDLSFLQLFFQNFKNFKKTYRTVTSTNRIVMMLGRWWHALLAAVVATTIATDGHSASESAIVAAVGDECTLTVVVPAEGECNCDCNCECVCDRPSCTLQFSVS
jgi:hypothetical protein